MTVADPMAKLFGNTILINAPEGWTRLIFRPDHTIGGANSRGEALAGTWVVENGMVWEMPTAPASYAAIGKHAFPVNSDWKVGDKWEYTRPNGQTISVEIVAGV
jgi:hypothetical protein